MPTVPQPFRVRPARLKRIRSHTSALEQATDPAAALAALFLLHCACKDVLKDIPAEEKKK